MTQRDTAPDDTLELTASEAMWYSGALPDAAIAFMAFYVVLRIISLPIRLARRALARWPR